MLTAELYPVRSKRANNIRFCVDTYIKRGIFFLIIYFAYRNIILLSSYSAISDAMSKVASAASTTSSSSMRNISSSNKSDNSPKKCKPDTGGGKSSSDANSGCGTPTATSESSNTNTNTRGEKSAKCKCYFLHPSISEK